VSKNVKRNLEQKLSKSECWGTALIAARKELVEVEERRALLLEAIPVFEKLAEIEKKPLTESGL